MSPDSSAPDAVVLRRTDSAEPASHSTHAVGGAVDVNGPTTAEGSATGATTHECPICAKPLSLTQIRKKNRSCSPSCGLKWAWLSRPRPERRINSTGYVEVWSPNHPQAMKKGYVLEHRMVLHDAGIEIPSGMHVHHINGDKLDNRRENLEVLTPAEHRARHHEADGGVVTNQFGSWRVGVVNKHGTAGYSRGCRCDTCRTATVAHVAAWRIRTGRR